VIAGWLARPGISLGEGLDKDLLIASCNPTCENKRANPLGSPSYFLWIRILAYTAAISGSLTWMVTTSFPLSFLPRILTSDWKCLLAPSNTPRKKSSNFLSEEYLISKWSGEAFLNSRRGRVPRPSRFMSSCILFMAVIRSLKLLTHPK